MARKRNISKSSPIGQFIENQLAQRGQSQNATAAKTGISQAQLSRIIRGGSTPSVEVINQIADHFEVPRTYLYEMMGWVESGQVREDNLAYLQLLIESDKGFLEMAKLYACMSTERRQLALRLMTACAER